MSGPLQQRDVDGENLPLRGVETRRGRHAEVGGLPVVRVLPTRARRTVGAWCFVDLLGPADAHEPDPMEVGPHPHIGLSTVTWLFEGEAVHRDSLGSDQVIRPGQLNLMTAGHGIAHAELAASPPFRGAQLWIAQPEATRHGASRFEHHAEVPEIRLTGFRGRLLVGSLGAVSTTVRVDSALVGAELTMDRGRQVLPVQREFEHGVVPVEGRLRLGDDVLEPGSIGLVPEGFEELPVSAEQDAARFLLLGGRPLGERIVMWWNFVARERHELERAYRDWEGRSERFAPVSSPLERVEAPRPPWLASGR